MAKKTGDNPMDKARAAPRCHAHSKRTGLPCGAPAVRGWKVCRFHGAGGGAPRGPAHGNYRNGSRTKRTMTAMMAVQALARLCRQTLDDIEG